MWNPDALFDLLGATYRKAGLADRRPLFVADGSCWIWDRVPLYFPNAIQVLDIYHAAEHVASAAVAWHGENSREALAWRRVARQRLLDPGRARQIVRALVAALKKPDCVASAAALRKEVGYLFQHRHRMPYHRLKAEGMPVGSGAMESAIKQLSTQRLRQPGMKWTRAGADAIPRLRAAHLSGALRMTTQRRHRTLQQAAQRYSPAAMQAAA